MGELRLWLRGSEEVCVYSRSRDGLGTNESGSVVKLEYSVGDKELATR